MSIRSDRLEVLLSYMNHFKNKAAKATSLTHKAMWNRAAERCLAEIKGIKKQKVVP